MSDPIEILDYWLGEVGPEGWYRGGEELDDDIRARFSEIWQAAREDGLEHWVEGTVGTLAYIILCDQLARNMHRGHADAFATDAQARAAARKAVAEGWDMNAPEPERQFFYMPFEHSEDPADQERAVTYLTERLSSDPEMALHARADHRALWPVSVSQRGLGARKHGRGAGLHGRRRLWRHRGRAEGEPCA